MDLVVKYIGNDVSYFDRIQKRFTDSYDNFQIKFIHSLISDDFDVSDCFIQTYKEKPQIIYLEFSKDLNKSIGLSKLFTKNNEMRLLSLVGLHDYTNGHETIRDAILSGVRLNHFKSKEIHDVIYDPVSLLDVDLALQPDFVRGENFDKARIKQWVRVGYIADDHFHIETNSPLPEGEVIEIDNHPLENRLKSKRFFVCNQNSSDLYYNCRYSYDLEFTYCDDDYFKATEHSWIAYRKYKENPLGYLQDTGMDYKELTSEVKKRKSKIRYDREDIRQWIRDNAQDNDPKKVKVLVLDQSLSIFKELKKHQDKIDYALNIQTVLVKDYFQISRMRPQLIVVNFDSGFNNEENLGSMIEKLKEMEGYDPYFLLFNFKEDINKLESKFGYGNLLIYPEHIKLETISVLALKIHGRIDHGNPEHRVYIPMSSHDSVITITSDIEVMGMTESIFYFKSKLDIPMWTVFQIETPISMFVTVVPHKEGGHFKDEANCYRSLINGVGEKEKAQLRALINKSFSVDEEE